MSWFTFIVETIENINGSTSHNIAKKAESSNYAMMQVVSDAMAENITIDDITYCGEYESKPTDCKERLAAE